MSEPARQTVPDDLQRQPCDVIPFPAIRRQGFVERNATKGEKYVRHLLIKQRERLQRLGVSPERIDVEMASLESAFLGDIVPEKVRA
jgi:hypothetical protein